MTKTTKLFILLSLIILCSSVFAVVEASNAAKNPMIFQEGQKYGLKDSKGNVVLKPTYDYIADFTENIAIASQKTGKENNRILRAIDSKGKVMFAFPNGTLYTDSFSDGLCAFYDGNRKAGFVDSKGKVVIKPQFDEQRMDFGGWGFVAPYRFSSGAAPFNKNGKFGIVDKQGKVLLKPTYDYIESFTEGLASAMNFESNGYVYLNTSGKVAITMKDCRYQFTEMSDYRFYDGFALFTAKDYLIGVIDNKGKIVIKPQFMMIGGYSEGFRAVMDAKTDKWGYISKGKLVIKPQYDEAGAFINGKATVVLNGKKLAIDKTGKVTK